MFVGFCLFFDALDLCPWFALFCCCFSCCVCARGFVCVLYVSCRFVLFVLLMRYVFCVYLCVIVVVVCLFFCVLLFLCVFACSLCSFDVLLAFVGLCFVCVCLLCCCVLCVSFCVVSCCSMFCWLCCFL